MFLNFFIFFFREMDEAAGEFDIAEYYRLHIAVERIRLVYNRIWAAGSIALSVVFLTAEPGVASLASLVT